MKNRLICVLNIIFLVLIDFVVKRVVSISLNETDEISFMNDLVRIVYVENQGAAFGYFKGSKIFLIGIPIVIILVFISIIFIKNVENIWFLTFVSFIVGGGIGNLLDRIFYGYVVDYIKLSFLEPVCNLADYFITFGVVGLIIYIFLLDKNVKSCSVEG